jgi:hypothetical protein
MHTDTIFYQIFLTFHTLLFELLRLKGILNDVFLDCYTDARNDTINKYQLPSTLFPKEPSFSLVQVLNADFIPKSRL